MKESATMTFVGWQASDDDDDDDEADVQNWYIDQVFRDLQKDIAEYYNISESAASSKLYTEGLKIYCAMDENAQTYLENAALNIDKSNDSDLQIASTIMGYDGRVIATVGSSTKKKRSSQLGQILQLRTSAGFFNQACCCLPLCNRIKEALFLINGS